MAYRPSACRFPDGRYADVMIDEDRANFGADERQPRRRTAMTVNLDQTGRILLEVEDTEHGVA